MGASFSRVMSEGVDSLDPALPLVMHTVTIDDPACAHLARVPATVNSWSSGWAWMLSTRGGAGGSRWGVERARAVIRDFGAASSAGGVSGAAAGHSARGTPAPPGSRPPADRGWRSGWPERGRPAVSHGSSDASLP